MKGRQKICLILLKPSTKKLQNKLKTQNTNKVWTKIKKRKLSKRSRTKYPKVTQT